MAVLQKIRVKFGLAISIIIALALLSFIIDPSTISSALQTMSSKYDVGQIAGKSISYTDFQTDVDTFSTINELLTGSSATSEEQQTNIRNAAWQNLIDKYLFVKNAKAAGLKVGEDEMLALTTGDMVSPVIAQSGVFVDENGYYAPDQLVSFVQNIDSDASGSLKTYWNYLQNTVYNQQFYTKYGALFTNSNIENPLTLAKSIDENNATTDVDFVMVPFGYDTDTTVVVTSAEIKDYYKKHKDFFKQTESRDLEYVVFEVVPSAADVSSTNHKFSDVYDEFATTDNMKSFLLKNSDRSLSSYWYKDGELSTINADIDAFVFENASGTSPVYNSGNTFYAARIMDTKSIPDSVYVKHILLQDADADHLADSLLNVVSQRGANFANLAAMYSADQGSADDGELGNIGWMTQTYMIQGFEDVITAPVGQPFILKTQYGTHVVLVSKTTKPVLKKQVAIMEKTAIASNDTFNQYYSKANKFAVLAKGGLENYRAALDSMGVYSHPLTRIPESTSSYGAIDNAKEVTRWAFDAKKGKVSDIITVNQNYFFVVALKDIHEEGYATIQEATSSIKQQLYSEKYSQKHAADVAEKIEGLSTLEEIADALNTSVSSQSGVTFSSLSGTSLDPNFVGALSVAPIGEVCGPVAGQIGTYVFQVTGRDAGSYYTEDDAKMLQSQKNQYNTQMIMSVMQNDANVVDHRSKFF